MSLDAERAERFPCVSCGAASTVVDDNRNYCAAHAPVRNVKYSMGLEAGDALAPGMLQDQQGNLYVRVDPPHG